MLESSSRLRSALFGLITFAIGSVIALLLLEILLRIHNPFLARIKGNRIVLVTKRQYHIRNDIIPQLDPVITVTRNSVGFRGQDPPADLASKLSIITVGGSTTMCFFLSDDQTWTARLEKLLDPSFKDLWVNNAGLDGHSTYGHLVMLEDHVARLRPKVVIFLIGKNDIGRDSRDEFDAENVKGAIFFHSPTAFIKSLSPYSEVASLIANLYRSLDAYKAGLLHQKIDLRQLHAIDPLPPGIEKSYIAMYAAPHYLSGYEDRVRKLIAASRRNGIEPVLVTQPLLVGPAIDDVTGLDLSTIEAEPQSSGKMIWDVQEIYNDVVRRVGKETGLQVIDLAQRLPKSSRNFYDFTHFTNAGAQAVAEILAQDLCPSLTARYPEFATQRGCAPASPATAAR
jgi:lysophospholipase L1-like esterase